MPDIKDNIMLAQSGEKAAKELKAQGKISTSKIAKSAEKSLKRIRELYKKALLGNLPPTRNTVPREWLCDNYYIIDRESRICIRNLSLKNKLYSCDGQIIIKTLSDVLLNACGSDVHFDYIESFLSGVQRIYKLSDNELLSFKDMLSASVIEKISKIADSIEIGNGDDEIAGCIATLRMISGMDFTDVFERLSSLENILLCDPSGIYGKMDESTKAYYRSSVFKMASKCGISEQDIALKALKQAEVAKTGSRGAHIGAHLDIYKRSKLTKTSYMLLYFIIPIILAALMGIYTRSISLGVLSLFVFWEVIKSLLDIIYLRITKPSHICRLKTSEIPQDVKTTFVISCLVTSSEQVKRLTKSLLQIKLSGGGNMSYGLLADFKESGTARAFHGQRALGKRADDRRGRGDAGNADAGASHDGGRGA